jgi:hypothetical protein
MFEVFLESRKELEFRVGKLNWILRSLMDSITDPRGPDSRQLYFYNTIVNNLALATHHTFPFLSVNFPEHFNQETGREFLAVSVEHANGGYKAAELFNLQHEDFLPISNEIMKLVQDFYYKQVVPERDDQINGLFLFHRVLVLLTETSCMFDLLYRDIKSEKERQPA